MSGGWAGVSISRTASGTVTRSSGSTSSFMLTTATSDAATTDSITSSDWSSRARSVELAILLGIAAPLLFFGLGLSFLDPDEGLYGAIAQEMLARGDWGL